MNDDLPYLTVRDTAAAVSMWHRRYDTYQISIRLGVSEAAVFNSLRAFREKRRKAVEKVA